MNIEEIQLRMVCLSALMATVHSSHFTVNGNKMRADENEAHLFLLGYERLSNSLYLIEKQVEELAEQLAKVM